MYSMTMTYSFHTDDQRDKRCPKGDKTFDRLDSYRKITSIAMAALLILSTLTISLSLSLSFDNPLPLKLALGHLNHSYHKD